MSEDTAFAGAEDGGFIFPSHLASADAVMSLVKLLEDANWKGMRHFDAHAYRTEDENGVWNFAAGCMRTYLILKAKAEQWRADAEIQQILNELRSRGDGASGEPMRFTPGSAASLSS